MGIEKAEDYRHPPVPPLTTGRAAHAPPQLATDVATIQPPVPPIVAPNVATIQPPAPSLARDGATIEPPALSLAPAGATIPTTCVNPLQQSVPSASDPLIQALAKGQLSLNQTVAAATEGLSKQVGAVAKQVDTTSQQVGVLAKRQEKTEGDVAEHRAQLRNHDKHPRKHDDRLENAEDNVDELHGRVEKTEGNVLHHSDRLNTVEKTIARMARGEQLSPTTLFALDGQHLSSDDDDNSFYDAIQEESDDAADYNTSLALDDIASDGEADTEPNLVEEDSRIEHLEKKHRSTANAHAVNQELTTAWWTDATSKIAEQKAENALKFKAMRAALADESHDA
jgi:hypothetical protein